ncbi:MAG: hypothetical protein IJK44_00845 [Bacteroidales bacterium]|nr:hypothetical protein [Bacteroidales bacterium]
MKRGFKVSGYIIAFLGYLLFGFLSWLNLCLATGAPWVEYSLRGLPVEANRYLYCLNDVFLLLLIITLAIVVAAIFNKKNKRIVFAFYLLLVLWLCFILVYYTFYPITFGLFFLLILRVEVLSLMVALYSFFVLYRPQKENIHRIIVFGSSTLIQIALSFSLYKVPDSRMSYYVDGVDYMIENNQYDYNQWSQYSIVFCPERDGYLVSSPQDSLFFMRPCFSETAEAESATLEGFVSHLSAGRVQSFYSTNGVSFITLRRLCLFGYQNIYLLKGYPVDSNDGWLSLGLPEWAIKRRSLKPWTCE